MLSSALGRNVRYSALHYFQQSLLYALTAHVSCNGCILRAARYLVYLVYIDYSVFCRLYVIIRRLYEPQQYILDIFTDISSLCERRSVRYRKGYMENSRKRLSKHRFSHAGRSEQQHVTFLELNVYIVLAVCKGTLIMVVDRDTKRLLGFILSDNILIEDSLDISRLYHSRELIFML